jgi:hypothetical protein
MTDKQIKELKFLRKIQSLRSDEYNYEQHANILFISFNQADEFSNEVLVATKNLIDDMPGYKIEGVFKDALLKLIKDAIDYDSKQKMTPLAYSKFHETLTTSRMLFVSKSDLEFLTFFNRKLKKNGVMRAILGENIHEYNYKVDFSETQFCEFEKTFLQKIQLLGDENIFFETFKSAVELRE